MTSQQGEIAKEIALQQYEQELAQKQAQQDRAYAQFSSTMFPQGGQKQNLIEWELDFKPELENIERLLRCDVIVRDKDNNEYWAPNPDHTRIFFNEQGVSDLIRNIIIIVNKNKALSNYTAEEINERVRQIKHEIRILIYTNYEEYGIDNDYKMNNYSIIVLSIGSIIEDVYRRAMGGATHTGLNEQRIVQQSEPLTAMPQMGMSYNPFQQKKKGVSSLLPWNWGKV